MEIKITDKGSFNYYDEIFFLGLNYKRIFSKNNIKIKRLTHEAYKYSLVSFIILILFLIM